MSKHLVTLIITLKGRNSLFKLCEILDETLLASGYIRQQPPTLFGSDMGFSGCSLPLKAEDFKNRSVFSAYYHEKNLIEKAGIYLKFSVVYSEDLFCELLRIHTNISGEHRAYNAREVVAARHLEQLARVLHLKLNAKETLGVVDDMDEPWLQYTQEEEGQWIQMHSAPNAPDRD